MLKGVAEPLDLIALRDELVDTCNDQIVGLQQQFGGENIEFLPDEAVVEITYPVDQDPEKIKSLNLDKTPSITGTLLGIKGQYLIMDSGVINIRKYSGYKVDIDLI